MTTLDPFRRKARTWLVDAAVPLWSSAGLDRRGGGFFETLTYAGVGDATALKRVRVQARQIYTLSHAHLLGLSKDALTGAETGYAFLTRRAWAIPTSLSCAPWPMS